MVSISISGTTIDHAIVYGETLAGRGAPHARGDQRQFSGVWADDNFGTSTTLRIQSKAPSWTFTGARRQRAELRDAHARRTTSARRATRAIGRLIDSVSPVMTEGARKWIRDLAGQFAAAGIPASFAFSMEVL